MNKQIINKQSNFPLHVLALKFHFLSKRKYLRKRSKSKRTQGGSVSKLSRSNWYVSYLKTIKMVGEAHAAN